MIILGIETSCDETALALIDAKGNSIRILGNIIHSQADLHAKYGGVFPNLAKREHQKNLIPLLDALLKESGLKRANLAKQTPPNSKHSKPPKIYSQILDLPAQARNLRIDLEREPELLEQFGKFIPTIEKPPIDAIAVTFGPGLEPALWVGINFAKALGAMWNIPVVPTNHMEGHIFSALLRREERHKTQCTKTKQETKQQKSKLKATRYTLHAIRFPAIALLISGGHTELVLVKKLSEYKIIGETKDDAVGEAFDKVARLLVLKYPGGPEISALAEQARKSFLTLSTPELKNLQTNVQLPRPMLHSGDYHFSFSGLKTAVLYTVKKIPKLTAAIKQALAREFEDSVTEVLISKTTRAVKEFEAKTLIIAGGVIANKHIRSAFEELRETAFPSLELLIPEIPHSTDNALMIALAGFLNLKAGVKPDKSDTLKIVAEGRARL